MTSGDAISPRARGKIASLAVALMCATYTLSRCAQPSLWSLNHELDASWHWALSKLQEQGQHFGVDVFFTYGPLAQHLGPLIHDRQVPGVVFYLIAFWYAACMFVCVLSLLEHIRRVNTWVFVITASAFLLWIPVGSAALTNDALWYCLLVLLCLSAYVATDPVHARLHVGLLMAFAVITLQIKFTVGSLAAAVFLLAVVFRHAQLGTRFAMLVTTGFVASSYLLFWALTGSTGFHSYLYAGYAVSAKHSEVMVLEEMPQYEVRYLLGAAYSLSFLGLLVLLARQWIGDARSRFGLILSGVAVVYLLYKHAFVRSDIGHNWYLYAPLLPAAILVAGFVWARSRPRIAQVMSAAVLCTALVGAYGCHMCFAGVGAQDLLRANLMAWESTPGLLWNDFVERPEFTFEQANAESLRDLHPGLFRLLDTLCQHHSTSPPTITFYPWETMYAAAVPGCEFQPMPSLQIYPEGPNSRGHLLDQEVLSSDRAPDIVVLGSGVVDWRNSLSEFTNWLEPLFEFYETVGIEDGYAVLKRSSPDRALGKIVCRDHGPSLFLRATIQPAGTMQPLLFRLGTLLWKTPELVASIVYADNIGGIHTISSRAYWSQLIDSVYFSGDAIANLLAEGYMPADVQKQPPIETVLCATLVRSAGMRNLPIVPDTIPIRIEYCSPERYEFPSQEEREAEVLPSLSLPIAHAEQVTATLRDGEAVYVADGLNPALRFDVEVPAALMPTLRVDMTLLPTGEHDAPTQHRASVFFRRSGQGEFAPEQRVDFVALADGVRHEYDLNMQDVAGWEGMIAEIRLNPMLDLTHDTMGSVAGRSLLVYAVLDLAACPR